VKLVYIAGPIRRGYIRDNVRRADDAMFDLMSAGVAVVNPMLSCYAGGQDERPTVSTVLPHPLAHGRFRSLGIEPWLTMDLEIVRRADAVLRLPGESAGADREVFEAAGIGIPIFHSVEEVLAWAR